GFRCGRFEPPRPKPKTSGPVVHLIWEKRTKKIKALSAAYAGIASDKRVTDKRQYHFPARRKFWKDTGSQGCEPLGVPTYQHKEVAVEGRTDRIYPAQVPLRLSVQLCGLSHQFGRNGQPSTMCVVFPIKFNIRSG